MARSTTARSNDLAELCQVAGARARDLGHDLEPWEPPPGEEQVARRTACKRCGRVLYARAEGSLIGAAGPAASEPCST